jgi:hypothetical protein
MCRQRAANATRPASAAMDRPSGVANKKALPHEEECARKTRGSREAPLARSSPCMETDLGEGDRNFVDEVAGDEVALSFES